MSFLPFIAGLASGTSEAYQKISEEDRKQKVANNKLVADSINERLKTDDSLTPDEQTHLLDQYLDLHGVDKKTKQHVIDASGYYRNAIGEQNRKVETDKARATMAQGPAPLEDAAPVQGLGDLPTYRSDTTAFAPEIPQYQPKTAGQLKFEESQPRVVQAEKDKAQAARDAQRAMATGEIQDKVDILKKYKDTPQEDDVRRMLGAAPKGTGAYGQSQPMRGNMLIDFYKQAGVTPPADIDPHRLYRTFLTPEKKPTNFTQVAETAVSGPQALGSSFIGMFDHDLAGNPINPNMLYAQLHAKEGGDLIGLQPAAQLGTDTSTTQWMLVPQTDGSTRVMGMPKETTSQKTANGVVVQNTPAPQVPGAPAAPGAPGAPTAPGVPSMPVGVAAKKTAVTPASPLPTAPAGMNAPVPKAQGPNPYQVKELTGAVVGGKPLTRDEDRARNNSLQALRAISRLRSEMEKDPNILLKAAIPGSIGARLFDQARNEVMDVLTRERTGAALNEDEQAFYRKQMIGLTDLISQHVGEKNVIEEKLKLYESLFNAVVQQYGRRAVNGYNPQELAALVNANAQPTSNSGRTTPKSSLPTAPAASSPDKDEIRKILRGGK